MRRVAWIFLIIGFRVIPTFAQSPIQIEGSAYVGVPVKPALIEAFCCTTAASFVSYEPEDSHFIAGFSAGVVIHDRVHITFGAMVMPISFVSHRTTCCPISDLQATEHGTSWDFPLLADYRWLSGRVRPFSGGGLVLLSHTTKGPDQTPAPVISGGVEWIHQPFAIRPEIRYIHYPQQPGSDLAVERPANQFQILIGFTFRK